MILLFCATVIIPTGLNFQQKFFEFLLILTRPVEKIKVITF